MLQLQRHKNEMKACECVSRGKWRMSQEAQLGIITIIPYERERERESSAWVTAILHSYTGRYIHTQYIIAIHHTFNFNYALMHSITSSPLLAPDMYKKHTAWQTSTHDWLMVEQWWDSFVHVILSHSLTTANNSFFPSPHCYYYFMAFNASTSNPKNKKKKFASKRTGNYNKRRR